MSEEEDKPAAGHKKPGFLSIVGSVLAAGLGVQSSRNRQRDFEHGDPKIYIIAGLVFTVLFIATVIAVVATVLSNVG